MANPEPLKRKIKKQPSSQLEDRLRELTTKFDKVATPKYDRDQAIDATRSMIANWFVKGFVLTLVLILAGIPIYNIITHAYGVELLSFKDVLLSVSGYISGPFGFVIGHYFKSDGNGK